MMELNSPTPSQSSGDIVQNLARFLKTDVIGKTIITLLDMPITSDNLLPEAFSYLPSLLVKAPITPHSSEIRPPSDLKALWNDISHQEHAYAEFLLAMWGDPAFTRKFEGDALRLFQRSLEAYTHGFNPARHYGKIIAMHTLSGAGKSKEADTLKDVVHTILPPAPKRVATFLGAFFEVAVEQLKVKDGVTATASAHNEWKYVWQSGVEYANSKRGTLFARVANQAQALLNSGMDTDPAPALVEPAARYRELWNRYCKELAVALAAHHIPELWFILLGTNTKIQSLVPSAARIVPSARFPQLQCLPAWCYFGFGQLAPPEPDTPCKVLHVDYLRMIGHPLFAAYNTPTASYLNAGKKLFSPKHTFDTDEPSHVFTAFSHRILLELGSTDAAHDLAAESMNSNLRYATRIDVGIVRTVCPSEPLLSFIASDTLNKGNNFVSSLCTLVDAVNAATIDRGQEGELYCRLLIIRACDVALQKNINTHPGSEAPRRPKHWRPWFSDQRPLHPRRHIFPGAFTVRLITLENHLDALVHLEQLEPSDQVELRQVVAAYHVNITHMIQFDDEISALPQTYLCSLFIRGAAVQCCHRQPVIDGFWVAYKGDLDQPFDLNQFLVVSWQSKAKAAAASQTELVNSLTSPMQINSRGKHCKVAQLVILMDLQAKASFKGQRNTKGEIRGIIQAQPKLNLPIIVVAPHSYTCICPRHDRRPPEKSAATDTISKLRKPQWMVRRVGGPGIPDPVESLSICFFGGFGIWWLTEVHGQRRIGRGAIIGRGVFADGLCRRPRDAGAVGEMGGETCEQGKQRDPSGSQTPGIAERRHRCQVV
ncbi:hypothetical protein DFH07DRAFT_977638 [Mycena maculata]|uniref:Uncharacterized protein n=1 Tax=Mycena maculata TaxID=230809 RepID=A0AAD7IKX1_9AGAR|nr:hypothetical protein DFH07DRAFT_977638 [Mycena maculata]